MPQQPRETLQNSFIAGLKTEFTGLNFPENSATDTQNCIYTLIGDVLRREGIDIEVNGIQIPITRTNLAINTYKWNNVGGDGSTQIVALQVGNIIYFFQLTNAIISSPLSTTKLASTVDISNFLAQGSVNNPSTIECQFTDGNGYLFIFHPYCDPIYCVYNAGVITGTLIPVQIRDFIGIQETVLDNFRPITLTADHTYNLQNQGWNNKPQWSATSTSNPVVTSTPVSIAFTGVPTGLSIVTNDTFTASFVAIQSDAFGTASGVVTSYSGSTLTVNLLTCNYLGQNTTHWTFTSSTSATSTIPAWFTALANYPSNSDVWWTFKNSSDVFAPSTTVGNVTLDNAPAPKGSYVLNAFQQQRSSVSSVAGLTDVTTMMRPRTGTWYEGRLWFAGVDASQQATGDASYYTWTENIYFSQIVTGIADFGQCYQINDPTSETLFDVLPSDGGVIVIQGCGPVYRLFPVKMGVIVFAANGIWYITGSQGTGFKATDYSIIKISNIQSISSTSFVNVNGFPMFWNEEGIYYVAPSQQGGSAHSPDIALDVTNLCLGTILTYYANIPLQSKKYARGDYDPLGYIVQWCYRSTNETDITSRYQFDTILNFNTANKAFFPYTVSNTPNYPWIHGITYVAGPGGSTSPTPTLKYISSMASGGTDFFSFADEHDSSYLDWSVFSTVGLDYTSYFVTGYSLEGKAVTKFQIPYLYMFSRNSAENKYIIQSIWDYAGVGNSGRWSVRQVIDNNNSNFASLYRKHRLRGRGLAVQIKVSSVEGFPFDLMGWSVLGEINTNV